MDDNLEAAIQLLEKEAQECEKPPAMVVLPPDMGQSIIGNRGGFIRLAIAALNAARGDEQKFTKNCGFATKTLTGRSTG